MEILKEFLQKALEKTAAIIEKMKNVLFTRRVPEDTSLEKFSKEFKISDGLNKKHCRKFSRRNL